MTKIRKGYESKENLYKHKKLFFHAVIFGFVVIGFVIIFASIATSESGAPPPGPGDSDGGGPYYSTDDWIIQEQDNITRSNQTIILSGNLIIENGGTLTFRNVTLILNCSDDGEFGIEVKNGSGFYILDSDNNPDTTEDRSNITAVNASNEFKFLVNSGAEFIMKNSELSECGYSWTGENGKRGLTIKTDNAVIQNSSIYNNYYGIYLSDSNNCKITNNDIYSSDNDGMYLYSSSNNSIIDNNVFSNNDDGIYFYSSDNNIIKDNTIYNNDAYGIYIYQLSNNNQISNNNFSHNYLGIAFRKSDNNVVTNNSIYSNNDYGIHFYSSSNNTITNTNVSNNNIGIYLYKYSINNQILNSTIFDSIKYDFNLSKSSDITVINTTFGKDKVYFEDEESELFLKWDISIKVLDRNKKQIYKAKVRIRDNENGTYDKNYTTDTKGDIKLLYLTEYVEKKNNSKTYYSPYNITVEKDGIENSTEIEMNQSREITITLNMESKDWIVTGTEISFNETIILDGNLTIGNGGNLTFRNVTLIMNCSEDGEFGIEVKDGGKFFIFDYDEISETTFDKSKITANNKNYEFKFLVDFGAKFEMKNSDLSECGYSNGNDGRAGPTIKTNDTIINNSTFYNNYPYGIYLYFSNNNTITNNYFYNNHKCIYLTDSDNNTIANNSVSNNEFGIFLKYSNNNKIINNNVTSNNRGIHSLSSSNNLVIDNNVSNNDGGISLYISSNNQITNNSVFTNSKNGISLDFSSNNKIINNKVINNKYGIRIDDSSNITMDINIIDNNDYNFDIEGNEISHYYHNIDTTNTVNGKSIYYMKNQNGLLFDNSTNIGYLGLISCSNVTIKNLSLTNNRKGILFMNTTDSLIEYCEIRNNEDGIYVDYSNNIQIINNNIFDNNYGIYSSYSNNNQITNNSAYSNSQYGISLRYLTNNQIINNSVYYNERGGIKIYDSYDNQIINNNYYSNEDNGIYLTDSNNNYIINNSVYNNQWCGINLIDSDNNQIINNNVYSNKDHGIYLRTSINVTVINSSISDSNEYDLYLKSNSNLILINTTFNKNDVFFEDEDSELIVKWYLNVEVLDKNKNPIPNAKVRIQDNENGTFDKNYTTNSKGWINWIVCTEYNEIKSEKTYYTPHTINASENKKFNQTQVFIKESKKLIIIIEKEVLDVKITNPKNDETVKNIVTIIVDIKNATNLEFITFRIDGIELQNSTSTSFEWNTKDYENKKYTIIVTAKNNINFAWDTIEVTLNNDISKNHAPVIITKNVKEADIFEYYLVEYKFTDEDITDIHTWSLEVNLKTDATWLNIYENGILYGEPTEKDIGSYWVNITVTDNGNPPLSDYTEFTLVVDDFPDYETFNNEELGVIVTIKYLSTGIVEISEPKQLPKIPKGLSNIKIVDITPEETLEIIWANITIIYKNFEISEGQEGKAFLDENTLKIYYWENSKWKLPENNGLDRENKIAWANISHFTIFGLLGEEITQDIEIRNISFQKQALEGQEITIDVTIKNIGSIPISNFTVIFYYGENIIGTKVFNDTLDVGEVTTITVKWKAVLGNHTIKVEVKTSDSTLLGFKESDKKIEIVKRAEVTEEKEEKSLILPFILVIIIIILLILLLTINLWYGALEKRKRDKIEQENGEEIVNEEKTKLEKEEDSKEVEEESIVGEKEPKKVEEIKVSEEETKVDEEEQKVEVSEEKDKETEE